MAVHPNSGGFTVLRDFGFWRSPADDYLRAVARYDQEIGGLEWAAPQDWMCEPSIRARTGLSIREHQQRTVENYLHLRELWPQHSDSSYPIMPALEGWTVQDYLDCVDLYAAVGVDLIDGEFASDNDEPVIGVGRSADGPPGRPEPCSPHWPTRASHCTASESARAGRHAKCTSCLPFAPHRQQPWCCRS